VPTNNAGDFEIFLGPNPPGNTDGSYWVKLEPERRNIMLILRETFYDWDKDVPMELHIEILDRIPEAPIHFSEKELAERFDRATKFLEFNFYEYTLTRLNQFALDPPPGVDKKARNEIEVVFNANALGGNPLAIYGGVFFDIEPDEALMIDL